MGIRNRVKDLKNEYTSLSHHVVYYRYNFREIFKGEISDVFKPVKQGKRSSRNKNENNKK